MMNRAFALFVVALLLTSVGALALGPASHEYIGREAVRTAPDSPYKTLALANLDDYLAGSESSDIAVIFYFSSFEKDYSGTHNWEFCNKMLNECAEIDNGVDLNRQRAYAAGCFAHLAADSYSHNTLVPRYLGNFVVMDEASLHPMVEETLDKYYYDTVPGLQDDVDKMVDKSADFIPMLICANGGSDSIGGIQIKTLLEIHRQAIIGGNYYQKGYGSQADAAPAGSKVYVFWKMFKFVNKPFATYLIKIDNPDEVKREVTNRIQLTLSATPPKQFDPTGSTALKNANVIPSYIQLAVSGLTAILMLWFARRKRWTLAVAGLAAIASAFFMWYMGFLGILFVWAIFYFASFPYLVWIAISKFGLRRPMTRFQWFVIIFNVVVDLIVLWISFI